MGGNMKNEYEIKKEATIQYYRERAEQARREAESIREYLGKIADAMAGTPILIGHHSEHRHRRDLERQRKKMDKVLSLTKTAEYLERKAESLEGDNRISSDDPDAIEKLKQKLIELQAEQERMIRINKLYRIGGWKEVREISEDDRKRCDIQMDLLKSQAPFAPFEISNNSARIRATQKRIKELEARANESARADINGVGFIITECPEDNRIRILFDEKPHPKTCKMLKSNGWRWSPTNKAWQRHLNQSGRYSVETVTRELKGRSDNSFQKNT
jgi:hypothetical protein